jgi:hypothetical protein
MDSYTVQYTCAYNTVGVQVFLLELVVKLGENLSSFLVCVRKSPHVSEKKHR